MNLHTLVCTDHFNFRDMYRCIIEHEKPVHLLPLVSACCCGFLSGIVAYVILCQFPN